MKQEYQKKIKSLFKKGKKAKKEYDKKHRYRGKKEREIEKKIKKDRKKALQKGEGMVI